MGQVKIYRAVAKLNSLNLFFLDTRTQGPVILCLHGRWGRAQTWHAFMQQYGKEYRIIAPDQRGHGLSDKPVSRYTAEEMAEDAAALLDYLNIERVILAGHSMGGRIAGHFAALYPARVQALAILDKSADGPAVKALLPLADIPAVDPLTKDWPMPFATLQQAQAFLREYADSALEHEYFMGSLYEDEAGYQMRFSAQAIAANIAHEESWYHLLPRIQCPVLLVRSSSHEAVPDEAYEKMQSLLQNCTAREISNPDHNVHLSNPPEFYAHFDAFLSNTPGGRPSK